MGCRYGPPRGGLKGRRKSSRVAEAPWRWFSPRLRRRALRSTTDQRRAPSPTRSVSSHSCHARCLASSAWSLAETRVRVAWMVPGGGRRTLLLCARRGDWLGDVQSIGATPRALLVSGRRSSRSFAARGADGLDLVSVESGTTRLRAECGRAIWSRSVGAERIAGSFATIAKCRKAEKETTRSVG